jgi:Reverse transcriptase (RNA-dependent DNA polymerase)
MTFDESNGSQVEQVDPNVLGDEEIPSEAIKKMAIGEIKPQEPQEQQVAQNDQTQPSSSTLVEPSTSIQDQGENQLQDQNQPYDDSNKFLDDDEVEDIQPQSQVPHSRVHQSIQRNQSVDNILGDIQKGVTTRSRIANFCECYSFVSSLEPLKVEDALGDPDWVMPMQEELNNFKRNEVWTLVERPNQNVIGTKWVFHNKKDENRIVTRNKARLVAQGFTQIEGFDFGKTYAPVARLESICILLAYATHHDFKLYQMDVKSAFLNGPIFELVYVEQPPRFEDPKYPSHVYKLHKALYGLKQAPRACYECLRDFVVKKGFEIGKADSTHFTKNVDDDLFFSKYMSMTLYLVLLINSYVKNFVGSSQSGLRCQ